MRDQSQVHPLRLPPRRRGGWKGRVLWFVVAVWACAQAGVTTARADLSLFASAKGGISNLVIVDTTYNGTAIQYRSGIQTATVTDPVTHASSTFDAYCVDLDHTNNVPVTYPVTITPTSGLANSAKIGYLYDTDAAGASNDRIKAAALQVAIWETLYGSSKFVDTDTPNASGTDAQKVAAQAQAYINDLTANFNPSASYPFTWYVATHSGSLYQNLIGPPGVIPTPEPSTMMLGGIGAIGALALVRRRRSEAGV